MENLKISDSYNRQSSMFLLLFSIGSSLKSIVFNNFKFSAQDCIGASITISIVMYMEIYRDKELYKLFLDAGNKKKKFFIFSFSFYVVLSFIITKIVYITLSSDSFSALLSFTDAMEATIYGLIVFFIYSFCYAIITMFYFLVMAHCLSLLDNYMFKGSR